MEFDYRGKKSTSSGGKIGAIFQIVIGVLLLVLSSEWGLLEDMDGEFVFTVVIMIGLIISGVLTLTKRSASKMNANAFIIDNKLSIGEAIDIDIESLNLDVYIDGDVFYRYHLYDEGRKLSIFSIYDDDLIKELRELPVKLNIFIETSAYARSGVSVKTKEGQSLYYSLIDGSYKVVRTDASVIDVTPQCFVEDPKYRKLQS